MSVKKVIIHSLMLTAAFWTLIGLVWLYGATQPVTLTCSPATVQIGNTAMCTLSQNNAAKAGGELYNLKADNPAVLYSPATATIPAGMKSVTFTVRALKMP